MQDLTFNQYLSPKEPSYKSYRRLSNSAALYNGQGFYSLPSSMEIAARQENANESECETKNTLTVSIIGLFLLVISFAYAIIISAVCRNFLGWKSNAFSRGLRQRSTSKSSFVISSSSSQYRKSSSQGWNRISGKESDFFFSCYIPYEGFPLRDADQLSSYKKTKRKVDERCCECIFISQWEAKLPSSTMIKFEVLCC